MDIDDYHNHHHDHSDIETIEKKVEVVCSEIDAHTATVAAYINRICCYSEMRSIDRW